MKSHYLQQAVGKRKLAVARVYLKEGKGSITVNKQDFNEYFLRPTSKKLIEQPLELTDCLSKYDINVNVCGGGLSGQAGAIRHGISKILSAISDDYRVTLKKAGLITRDSRKKERKLPGQPGARKKFQFSKR